jgi:putative nucleotidyltransferase with HDIG domain
MLTDAHPPLNSRLTLAQIAREQRLQLIIRKGLPPFRQTALELTKALGGESPDMKKAGKLISADPTLSSQVLRMCNSPMLGMHSRVISIDHATMLLGPERLRNLALTTSMADFAGKALPERQMNAFWQHSFMTAMLAQYLAERLKYFEKYQAYIAGLLHDIGQVPEWVLLSEGGGERGDAPSDWADNISAEREYFGTDHCKLGGIMARSWDLMPSFLDVLENHHTPELARRDSILVRIVATADYFLATKVQTPPLPRKGQLFEQESVRFEQLGQGLFGEIEWPSVEESLELEYATVLPIAQAGLKGLLGGNNGDLVSDSKAAAQVGRNAGARLPKPSLVGAISQETRTSTQTVPSGSAPTLLARCKSFMKLFFP